MLFPTLENLTIRTAYREQDYVLLGHSRKNEQIGKTSFVYAFQDSSSRGVQFSLEVARKAEPSKLIELGSGEGALGFLVGSMNR